MSIAKFIRDIEQFFRYSTDAEPTTQQEFQEAMKNWVRTIESIVDCTLWQPETTYQVGDTVRTPSLSKQALLLCITAGKSGAAEPDYTDVSSNDEITDGTVVWRVQTVTSQEKAETYTDVQVSAAVPTGCVQAFAGNTLPDGWLLCDGSAVDRTLYAALFNVIGTTYGSGNSSTTFNLPNLTNKFIQGNATAGTVKSAGLPNIYGSFSIRGTTAASMVTGASQVFTMEGLGGSTNINATIGTGANLERTVRFRASDANAIYGNSTTVQPPAVTMRYVIKY